MEQAKEQLNKFMLIKQTSNQHVLKKLVNMARVQLTQQQHASTFKWAGNNDNNI